VGQTMLTQFWKLFSWGLGQLLFIVVFYILFLPIGFIMRLLGHDPLHRNFESTAKSYFHPSAERKRNHMDKPF
jgi:hypothetical protein